MGKRAEQRVIVLSKTKYAIWNKRTVISFFIYFFRFDISSSGS